MARGGGGRLRHAAARGIAEAAPVAAAGARRGLGLARILVVGARLGHGLRAAGRRAAGALCGARAITLRGGASIPLRGGGTFRRAGLRPRRALAVGAPRLAALTFGLAAGATGRGTGHVPILRLAPRLSSAADGVVWCR
jgi:hypothetical protein